MKVKYSGLPSSTKLRIAPNGAVRFFQKHPNVFIVADEKLAELYPELLPTDRLLLIKSGEESKNLDTVDKILGFLAQSGAKRDDLLVACGGGSVGDAAGFAAAIYMRGIALCIIPSTLLAMVDSSIGGKNGVNFAGVKNLVGTIYQPKHVVIDADFIQSLPQADFLSGIGEIIKHAFLSGRKACKFLLKNRDAILAKDAEVLANLIAQSVAVKAEIVTRDEREQGLRMLLNAGHTLGHAIEMDSDGAVPHGFAVATGLYLESLVGYELGVVEKETPALMADLLELYGFSLNYKPKNTENFLSYITFDKKQRENGLMLPFIHKAGKARIYEIGRQLFADTLMSYITL